MPIQLESLPHLSETLAKDVFPASLTVVHSAGLADALDSETTSHLKAIESEMREHIDIGLVLRARNQAAFYVAAKDAAEVVAGYHVVAGILIWRALKHDYSKLLQLSKESSAAIESLLLKHATLFEKTTLIRALGGLRTFGHVGELLVRNEETLEPQDRTPPFQYLKFAVLTSFVASCLIAHATGQVKRAREVNLAALGDAIFDVAQQAYESALEQGLFEGSSKAQIGYWNPEWQLGEVEADLDIQGGALKRFRSADELIKDMQNS